MTHTVVATLEKSTFVVVVTTGVTGSTTANDGTTANDSMMDDLNRFFYLHHSDQPSLILVVNLFVGTMNYTSWCKAMLMALTVKNKVAFINGLVTKLSPEDPFHGAWVHCNIIMCSWIMNSIL